MIRIFGAVLFFCVAFLASDCIRNDHDISISISEDDENYNLEAYYPKNRSEKIWRSVNKFIKPNQLGDSPQDVLDVTTYLHDGTSFRIQSSPGELKIKYEKDKNSRASYDRIRAMGKGIQEVLK